MNAQTGTSFINAALESTEAMDRAMELVQPEMFSFRQTLWQEVVGYREKYGEVPPVDLISNDDWEVVPHGTVEYEAEQLYKWYLARETRAVLQDNAARISEDPNAVIDDVITRLSAIGIQEEAGVTYFDSSPEVRADRVLELSKARDEGNAFIGIPTGLEPLDITGVGWRPATMSVIIGSPGTGKSEFLINSAVVAWAAGKRVIFVSTELDEEVVKSRADTILMRRKGLESYPGQSQLDTGRITDQEIEVYRNYLRDDVGSEGGFMILDQSGGHKYTVSQLRQYAHRHEADMIIVDGFKYLETEGMARTASGWEVHKGLFDDVLNLARVEGFAVLAAEHTNANVRKSTDEPMNSDSYMGRHPDQGCERIITLWKSRSDEGIRFIAMRKHRSGIEINFRKKVSYDPEYGDVGSWVDTEDEKASSELGEFQRNGAATPKQEAPASAL